MAGIRALRVDAREACGELTVSVRVIGLRAMTWRARLFARLLTLIAPVAPCRVEAVLLDVSGNEV